MILRDTAGSAIGHTEVYDPDTETPTAYLPAYRQTEAEAFQAAMWATAF